MRMMCDDTDPSMYVIIMDVGDESLPECIISWGS